MDPPRIDFKACTADYKRRLPHVKEGSVSSIRALPIRNSGAKFGLSGGGGVAITEKGREPKPSPRCFL